MQTVVQDVRFGLRMLRKNPGFTVVTVLTLALGMGLVSTQFSLIDGALLRPPPYPDSDRLFHFARLRRQMNEGLMPIREFLALREQQTAFEDVAAYRAEYQNLSHPNGTPRRLRGLAVTAGFFRLLRLGPQVGRDFRAGEDEPGQPLVAVIGHGVWQEESGGDTAVIGCAVRINGEPGTVIGVMPAGFRFPENEECWTRFRLDARVLTGVGVYGVMAFAVQRRTREFGIRLALGATGREILGLLFQQKALGTCVGVAAGLGLGFALTRPLAPYLLRVSANDPIIYAGVAMVLVAVTVLAIWIPSRRAARVDPMVALRAE